MALTDHEARVRDRIGGIRTHGAAHDYFEEVRRKTVDLDRGR
jgi:hypothetical protein